VILSSIRITASAEQNIGPAQD